jgi:hypothetical protein
MLRTFPGRPRSHRLLCGAERQGSRHPSLAGTSTHASACLDALHIAACERTNAQALFLTTVKLVLSPIVMQSAVRLLASNTFATDSELEAALQVRSRLPPEICLTL